MRRGVCGCACELQICPEGSAQPLPCPSGSIPSSDADATDSCVPCPYGKYCRGAAVAGDCLAGYAFPKWCSRSYQRGFGFVSTHLKHTVGRRTPSRRTCLRSYYDDRFFCGLGNWVPNPWVEQKPNEPYVPPSASAAGGVTILTLENWKDAGDTGYGGIPCPPGHYCPAGAKAPQPCPAGSVRQDRLGRWQSDCSICPKGYAGVLAITTEIS